jgi:hypothetical protein
MLLRLLLVSGAVDVQVEQTHHAEPGWLSAKLVERVLLFLSVRSLSQGLRPYPSTAPPHVADPVQ